MVQLKDGWQVDEAIVIVFQFLHGTIKRMVRRKAQKVCYTCFNSFMVQLKVIGKRRVIDLELSFNSFMVQLKANVGNRTLALVNSFNSFMVQLKEVAIFTETMRKEVSIPSWYN